MSLHVSEASLHLASLAANQPTRAGFRRGALETLREVVGFELGAFASVIPDVPTTLDISETELTAFLSARERFLHELAPLQELALSQAKPVFDTEHLTSVQRQRLGFYSELPRHAELRSLAVVFLTLKHQPLSVLYLARCGRHAKPFTDSERVQLQALMPALAVGDCTSQTLERMAPAPSISFGIQLSVLSPREREVVEYAALGYTNEDIAKACGSAMPTVRNQLSSVYRKLGVANRTELCRVLMELREQATGNS